MLLQHHASTITPSIFAAGRCRASTPAGIPATLYVWYVYLQVSCYNMSISKSSANL